MVLSIMTKKWRRLKKHTEFKSRVQKTYPFETKMAKIDTLFMTKTAEKPYPLGLHIPI